jgi:hypothetical protein
MRLVPLAAFLVLAAQAVGQTPTYRVYPMPVESPNHTTPPPPADARVLLPEPNDTLASRHGWLDTNGVPGPESTTATGNNVVAFFDINGNTTPEAGEVPDAGPSLAFDFALDLGHPIDFRDALSSAVFYWTNVFHDVTYRHGFTEVAGNFQLNNYGHGGVGGDAVRALVPAGGGGGATMSTPVDGQVPRLIIGGFVPTRPGALDAGVLVHELGHGISNRLTGGPASVGCLGNQEQGGEGWSDFFGLMLTMRTDHSGATGRTVGTWLLGEGPEGAGVRPARYSTAFAVNDYTYQDTRTAVVPHGVGFVWMTILWEVLWELIGASGYHPDLYDTEGTAGNQMALSLVTTGLKLQPCLPGFVDARDAILAADQVHYQGANTQRLWAAFARRGLGWSASQGSPATNADNTEAFDLPPTTAGSPEAPAPVLALGAPAPNPVAAQARIEVTVPAGAYTRLALSDMQGRELAVLADRYLAAGSHIVWFDVAHCPTGTYLLDLRAAGEVLTRRVTVIR